MSDDQAADPQEAIRVGLLNDGDVVIEVLDGDEVLVGITVDSNTARNIARDLLEMSDDSDKLKREKMS